MHHTQLQQALEPEPRGPKAFLSWFKFTFQSTVFDDIVQSLLFFTLFSTAITCVHMLTEANVAVSSAMLGVLGGLLGFVVSLRTSSAYERYSEGRRVWANILLHSRNFALLTWIHVPDNLGIPEGEMDAEEIALRALLEKKTIINLVKSYSTALKHFCRRENGVWYEDLYPDVCYLPKRAYPDEHNSDLLPMWSTAHSAGHVFIPSAAPSPSVSTAFSKAAYGQTENVCQTPEALSRAGSVGDAMNYSTSDFGASVKISDEKPSRPLPPLRRASTTIDLLPARMPPRKGLADYFPVIAVIRAIVIGLFCCRGERKPKKDEEMGHARVNNQIKSNIPLEISLFLSSYVARCAKHGINGTTLSQLYTSLNGLSDCLSALDRLINSALPFAYLFHLRLTVYIFLIFLPFQVVASMGWITIPTCFVTSLFYLGFLEIGQEIEDPFDYGRNDIDLDHQCLLINKEISEIVSHPAFEPWDYLAASPFNKPFATVGDNRSAKEILEAHLNREEHQRPEDVLKSVRTSLTQHFRHAAHAAVVQSTRHARHRAKKAPRTIIEVEAEQQKQH